MKANLADRLQVGSTSLKLPPMGFGAAHLGGMHSRVPGDVARATLRAAWDGGIRHYDTAPFYGLGLSEHRLGDFLIDQPRAEFIVTTKVGRVLHRPADPRHFDRRQWSGGLNFEIEWSYSDDGVMRAYEQSLLRLGLDTIDALLIHDPDAGDHGKQLPARMKDMADSGIKALQELKARGEIRATGMGLNTAEALHTIVPMVELDFCIVAMLTPSSTSPRSMPACSAALRRTSASSSAHLTPPGSWRPAPVPMRATAMAPRLMKSRRKPGPFKLSARGTVYPCKRQRCSFRSPTRPWFRSFPAVRAPRKCAAISAIWRSQFPPLSGLNSRAKA
jgi:Aldo/keto reductase family